MRAERGLEYARDAIAGEKFPPIFVCARRNSYRKTRKCRGRGEYCCRRRAADRPHLWRGRAALELLPAVELSRAVERWRWPPDPHLCARAWYRDRGRATACRRRPR